MAVSLERIIPWGRTGREYELMFRLAAADLTRGVLDCGGGPSSFAAEMWGRGVRVVTVDPIYVHPGRRIRERFEECAGSILAQVRMTPEDWTWSYHRDPDDLLAHRVAALERFLADYEVGRAEGRYLAGELPELPFANEAFGLAVCSHLLFLYSDLLSEEFHVRSVRELCRVAREVRIFPLLTLQRERSPHLAAVRVALGAGWSSEVVRVEYELQRGGHEMLRLFRPSDP
jgi:hypothetical protein